MLLPALPDLWTHIWRTKLQRVWKRVYFVQKTQFSCLDQHWKSQEGTLLERKHRPLPWDSPWRHLSSETPFHVRDSKATDRKKVHWPHCQRCWWETSLYQRHLVLRHLHRQPNNEQKHKNLPLRVLKNRLTLGFQLQRRRPFPQNVRHSQIPKGKRSARGETESRQKVERENCETNEEEKMIILDENFSIYLYEEYRKHKL